MGCRIQVGGCSGNPQGDVSSITVECVVPQRVKRKKRNRQEAASDLFGGVYTVSCYVNDNGLLQCSSVT